MEGWFRMNVASRPFPNLKTLLAIKQGGDNYLNGLIFFNRGREALLECLYRIGIPSGSAILIPAYICYSTVSPLIDAGYKIVYIDIELDFKLNTSMVLSAILESKARAILVVHYFGIQLSIQPIIDVCSANSVKVIEDYCHGFLGNFDDGQSGLLGDAAIFSMRKTFPVYDGGALKINNHHDLIENSYTKINLTDIFYLISRFFEWIICKTGVINIYGERFSYFKTKIRLIIESLRVNFVNSNLIIQNPPSFLLKKYLSSNDYINSIKFTVLRNYFRLTHGLEALGFKSYLDRLPPNCIPQWALFIDKDSRLLKLMRSKGIGASRWPWHELPKEVSNLSVKYTNAVFLDKNLVLLPIHQSIGANELDRVIAVAKKSIEK